METGPVALPPARGQIARSMRFVSALLVVTWLLASPALTGGARLSAQASPYVPVGSWTTPDLEYLNARRAIPDPSPLR